MKLSIVVPVLGQHALARKCLDLVLQNSTEDINILVIDNGGDFEHGKLKSYRPGKNIGVYPTFKLGMEDIDEITGIKLTMDPKEDIRLFIHSDLFITEPGFDKRIMNAFEVHPKLGLLGFIGSNEIDFAGGRGSGKVSNFQGRTYQNWIGSPAEVHGKRSSGYIPAAVVDGCAMVIRREAWDKIGYREDFPVHHFYDRLISTQMLEAGFQVAVLGIACDHISGQTVSKEDRYGDMAGEWCRAHITPDRWVGNPPDYAWDQTIYQEAERRWLREYRDIKHLVPIRV